MTQATNFGVPTTGPASPDVMAARIQNNFEAALTGHSGASRPSYAEAGTVWQDTSVPDEVKFYFYDGTDDILLCTVNTSTGAVEFDLAEGTVTREMLHPALVAQVDAITGRNLIINGQGRLNQRAYVSGTGTMGANQYTLDRWRVVTSGQNLAFTGDDSRRVMTAPAGGAEQVIEGHAVVGGTYVLNWTGTATATVNGTARAKGEAFTLPANTNATVRLSGGTFTDVQLELGSEPTAYERLSYTQELIYCARYYVFIGTTVIFKGAAVSGQSVIDNLTLPVRMRNSSPTVLFSPSLGTGHGASSNGVSIGFSSFPASDGTRAFDNVRVENEL